MIVSDYTKQPEQIIIDLINHDNGTSLTTDMLTFGKPSVLVSNTHNTKVTATATATSIYYGAVDLTYNRVDLSTIPGTRSVSFIQGTDVNLSDLVPEINAAYQLNLQPVDFIDIVIPAFDPLSTTPDELVDLVAGPDSLIFVGKLTLTIKRNKIPLSSVITTIFLDGLVYTQPI